MTMEVSARRKGSCCVNMRSNTRLIRTEVRFKIPEPKTRLMCDTSRHSGGNAPFTADNV